MQVEDVAVFDLEGDHIAGCLNAFTRDMISGRGFIGIAAQSLGTGRPVLPPAAGCHAALRHHQIVGLMLAGMRKNTPNTHLSGSTDAVPRS